MSKKIKLNDPYPSCAFNLLGLNDDCIIAVCRHLSLNDLGSIACTNSRLHGLARQVIVLDEVNLHYSISCSAKMIVVHEGDKLIATEGTVRFRYNAIGAIELDCLRGQQSNTVEIRVRQHLAAFGDLLKAIDFDYTYNLIEGDHQHGKLFNQPLFEDMLHQCSNTLQHLTIHNVVWTAALLAQAQPLLSRLAKFHSIAGKNSELPLRTVSPQCTDLNITGELCAASLKMNFVHLERFTLLQYAGAPFLTRDNTYAFRHHQQQLREFLRHHKHHLRTLLLDAPDHLDVAIIGELRGLKELEIHGWRSVRFSVAENPTAFQFSHITKLTLIDCEAVASQLVLRLAKSTSVAGHTLAHLHVSGEALSDDAVTALAHFRHLETVHIWDSHYSESVTMDNRQFPNLQQLKSINLIVSNARRYHFMAAPALETLTVRCTVMVIDSEFVTAVGRMPKLKHLSLCGVTINGANVATKLAHINRLESLEVIFDMGDDMTADYFTWLGSMDTLRLLKIKNLDRRWGSVIIGGLCRYRQLQSLHISQCDFGGVEQFGELRQLKSVKELHLNGNTFRYDGVLMDLGCDERLEKLVLNCVVDDETVLAICRYRNLREMTVKCMRDWKLQHLQALGCLGHLRKVTLIKGSQMGGVDWNGVVDFVDQLKSIRLLYLLGFDLATLTCGVADRLLMMCRRQNLNVDITVWHEPDNTFELPEFMFEADNCQYIQIKCEQQKANQQPIYVF